MEISLKSIDSKAIDTAVRAIIAVAQDCRVTSIRKNKYGVHIRVLRTSVDATKLATTRLPSQVEAHILSPMD